jgi:hypothetical protein
MNEVYRRAVQPLDTSHTDNDTGVRTLSSEVELRGLEPRTCCLQSTPEEGEDQR